MTLLSEREREVVEAVASLVAGNPFLPERVVNERRALGDEFTPLTDVWHEGADLDAANPNVDALFGLVERLAPELRERLASGVWSTRRELEAYQGLVFYLLYYRYIEVFEALLVRAREGRSTTTRMSEYSRYRKDAKRFLEIPGVHLPWEVEPPHLFALGYQLRRAFENTFRGIQGASMPAARMRAKVWQSIFTHDFMRYGRALYRDMGDVTTLILGESGTGKELVARAVGLARYIPFDEDSRCFAAEYAVDFHPVNLSALSPTLVESELFGHRRGAFTGAVEDRTGWLESCSRFGTVFLDEIGELDPLIQVKLLRVLQSRTFQRVGETQERACEGKIIAATNRDLPSEIAGGRFRRDLYYRLCADVVETPSLREQIAESPAEISGLIRIVSRRLVGADEAEGLSREVERFVEAEIGPDYAWPGNVRELEQCVRNILIHGEYRPLELSDRADGESRDDLGRLVRGGTLSADELLRHYCTQIYAQVGNYEEAARRLGLDRRTVKAKVDDELLERLRR